MRAEVGYPADRLSSRQSPEEIFGLGQAVSYFFETGEAVESGTYRCTFCGYPLEVSEQACLPLCPVCDSAEFAGPPPNADRNVTLPQAKPF
ncbi:MAG: hypothetical protein HY675_17555 [Chloroflexi bacterium]|nr:hypothetical protein [Chloroflexota bacterium]